MGNCSVAKLPIMQCLLYCYSDLSYSIRFFDKLNNPKLVNFFHFLIF